MNGVPTKQEFKNEISKQDPEAYCVFRDPCFVTVYCKYRKKVLDLADKMNMKSFGIIVDIRPLPRIIGGLNELRKRCQH